MRSIGRIIEAIANISSSAAGWVLLGAMSLVMIEVITRYVLRNPLRLADEISGYALVFISLIGLAYTMREGGHIRVTFLVSKMPPRLSNWLRLTTLTIFLVYSLLLTWVSITFVQDSVQRGMKSLSELRLPLVWPQLAMPIGFTILSLILVVILIRTIMDIHSGVSIENADGEIGEGVG